jgi:hypothetical protein
MQTAPDELWIRASDLGRETAVFHIQEGEVSACSPALGVAVLVEVETYAAGGVRNGPFPCIGNAIAVGIIILQIQQAVAVAVLSALEVVRHAVVVVIP